MPDVETARISGRDDLLWIDAGRYRFLNTKRETLEKAPTVLALMLRQVLAGFVERDRAEIAVAATEKERGPGNPGVAGAVWSIMPMTWECPRDRGKCAGIRMPAGCQKVGRRA